MSDNPGSGAPQLMRQLIQKVQQFDANLHRAVRALERRGIQFTFDPAEQLLTIRHDLTRAQQESERLTKQLVTLQALVQSSALITSSLQLEQVLDQVADSVMTLTGAERTYLMLRDRTTGELRIGTMRNCEALSEKESIFSRSVMVAAIEKGEPIVTTNAQDDARFQDAESVVAQGLRSILCIPLLLDDQLIGVLYADSRVRPGLFSADILPSLAAFGAQAAIAIEKARLHEEEIQKQRLEEELRAGRQIQFSLLPKAPPAIAGWDFAAEYLPARVVGGDFYDFFELPGNQIGIVIADVADKGIGAAIFMALSRTMIRSTALVGRDPADALICANDLIIQDSNSDLFLSAFYGALDPTTGRLVYTNAGHNRPLVLRAGTDTIEELRARGIILGVFPNIPLEERETVIAPGDVVLFYTDGLTEAMNAQGEEFGEARLRQVIADNRDLSAGEIANALLEAVEAFTGYAPQSDDRTLVVFKH